MPGSLRHAFASLALLGLVTATTPARAWVEQAVKSDSVTLDVERDGRGVVTHEILLWVRGGPLPEIGVEPVDEDAEILDGASATIAQSGRAAGFPLPLEASKDGAHLRLRVVGAKGLRTGTHLIRFAYRTNLGDSNHLHVGVLGTTLEWSGPRFSDGIDTAKVVFRLPPSSFPPRLGPAAAAGAPENVADDHGGVFLSTFRRTADKDELEVVRPHVAKNEIVAWRVSVDPSTFDTVQPATAKAPKVVPLATPHAPKVRPPTWPWWLAVAGLAALFGVAVALKSRWASAACSARGATPRPLLPFGTPGRAVLATASVLGSAVLVVAGMPVVAAAVLMVALASATHLPPRAAAPLRGPGKWIEIDPDAAFAEAAAPRTAGRFFDAGSAVGFSLFLSLLTAFVAVSITVMRRSEYYGLSVALGSALLFPIYCTGRAGELPPDPVRGPADLLDWLMSELGKDAALVVGPIGRVPLGKTEPDEIRLLVLPKRAMTGVVAIEAGLDVHQGALGLLALPFVLIRVVEGSPAAEALPKGLFWTRGRNVDERVAVLRPKMPTRRLTAALIRDLSQRISATKSSPPRRQEAPSSAAKSSGNGSSTAKGPTTSSPAHAT